MSTKPFVSVIETEPVASMAVAFGALVNAIIAALPLFGVPIDPPQQVAIGSIFTALLTLATVWQRQQVTPVEKANAKIEQAAKTGEAKPL